MEPRGKMRVDVESSWFYVEEVWLFFSIGQWLDWMGNLLRLPKRRVNYLILVGSIDSELYLS